MEQMTITAKVQIAATDADKVLLDETMSVYRDACNYVSGYVFQTHDLKQFSLLNLAGTHPFTWDTKLCTFCSFFVLMCNTSSSIYIPP